MKQAYFDELIQIIRQSYSEQITNTQTVMQNFIDQLDLQKESEDLDCYIFASALSKQFNFEHNNNINLYLQRFEVPQIVLFNMLAEHFPLVSIAGQLANKILEQFIELHDEISILNIGIGTGRQEVDLLNQLELNGTLPKKLTLFAVEPSAESLFQAKSNIQAAAAEKGIELVFHSFCTTAEELTPEDWNFISESEYPLLVNAAFALHHIRELEDGFDTRNRVIQHIHDLNPLAVILCEPHVDHNTSSLGERFQNCWRHFRTVFKIINQSELSDKGKNTLKLFFGREIEDILGKTENVRTERHEIGEKWIERLSLSGFTPVKPNILPDIPLPNGFSFRWNNSYLGLEYEKETLVSVLVQK
ncbi:GRAS family protein [Ectobacillus panaciterrae]|uniref:GRAS family protein n=1 Tax=Ectobacillus panaciterrae TaxID=363872 RepID=UPI000414ECA5|nr:GRAS family protein [Ectobacillus panaciterrae]